MSSEYGIPAAPVKNVAPRRRFFQLSYRTGFVFLSILAVIIGCIVATPLFAMLACLAYVLISGAVVATLLYGKGWIKGFAIGFSVPHLLGYVVALNTFDGPEEVLVIFLFANIASLILGVAMATARSFFKSRNGLLPVPNVPGLRNWLHND